MAEHEYRGEPVSGYEQLVDQLTVLVQAELIGRGYYYQEFPEYWDEGGEG